MPAAETNAGISRTPAADQTITVRLGAKTALALERPFETVPMGDPNIVDVHTLSDRRVAFPPYLLRAVVGCGRKSLAIRSGAGFALVFTFPSVPT
jgi:hypothetical protein